jgi:hypothetical protein
LILSRKIDAAADRPVYKQGAETSSGRLERVA